MTGKEGPAGLGSLGPRFPLFTLVVDEGCDQMPPAASTKVRAPTMVTPSSTTALPEKPQ